MSSDFFVFGASLLLISKRSGLVLIVTWWLGEPSITRNGQSRPFGRYTLIEIDLIRLEAVFCRDAFVRDVLFLYECEVSSIFFKDGIKVGFKMLKWWLERNMLVCFFRLLTKNVSGFAFISKFFLKCLCKHPRVRLTFWKLMCWICWHPRVRLRFYVRFSKMNCAGFSYCQILDTRRISEEIHHQISTRDPSEIFQAFWNDLLMMMQINSHGSWKRIFCANWKTCSWYWLL